MDEHGLKILKGSRVVFFIWVGVFDIVKPFFSFISFLLESIFYFFYFSGVLIYPSPNPDPMGESLIMVPRYAITIRFCKELWYQQKGIWRHSATLKSFFYILLIVQHHHECMFQIKVFFCNKVFKFKSSNLVCLISFGKLVLLLCRLYIPFKKEACDRDQ